MRRGVALLVAVVVPSCVPACVRAQSDSAGPPLPPPGRLVDLGGWRLHLHCTGERRAGDPLVVLEAGLGAFSVDWSLVQPLVAPAARVCAYDRGGMGWSDLGPRPRTMRQVVWELRELLARAGERAPYVLAGHSHGGALVRLYAATYPSDVAGMVLVDAQHEQYTRLMGGRLVRAMDLATGKTIPPVKTSDPLREGDIPPGIRQQIAAGLRAVAPYVNSPPRDKLPADARRMRAWVASQLKYGASNDNEFEPEELVAMLAERRRTAFPFGDLPIVVLTAGLRDGVGPIADTLAANHRRNQADLLTLSRRAQQVIAARSGHHIDLDEPERVADAVRAVLRAARR